MHMVDLKKTMRHLCRLSHDGVVQVDVPTMTLTRRLSQLTALRGCCGTDHRRVEHIASACIPLFSAPT